ncbi:UNVERIFIED_CONTAM: hypothetical protein Sradi_3254900 [Sesamum radiatum]|uniref:Integrase catalytic domain-containing protein n=1 Tax=Sesamum radiatum TaxID=300843 RepID=A0AAW2QZQ0_SESRA
MKSKRLRMIRWLGDAELEHLSRRENKQADAIAKLASTLSMTDKEARIPIYKSWAYHQIFSEDEDNTFQEKENHVMEIFEVEEEDWRQPLVDYLKYRKLPNNRSTHRWRTDTRWRATHFIYCKGTLYRRSFEGIFLCYLSDDKRFKLWKKPILEFVVLTNRGKLHFRIKRMGYYWLTMVKDWSMTKSSGGHLYILAATNYFSKWAETVPLKEVEMENIADFIHTNIIYRYRVPRYIVTDNGKLFCNSLIDKLCQKFGFKQRNSFMYYAATDGLAEAFNRTLCSLLKKVVVKSKRDWHKRIKEALWAYKTTVRTPTQSTLYALKDRVDRPGK